MLLTLTTTHQPATDLSFLLAKHPARFQSFELSFGQAHVFYPEVSAERTTAALLLDVDPVGMVRGKGRDQSFLLAQYVNDRPYVASSFLSVAIAQVLSSAMSGRCKERPELAAMPIPLTARIEVLPVRGGEGFLQRVFEPLGYSVSSTRHTFDGAAFAIKYRGGDQVSVCYFGEAAANIGAFHETLNMASLWELPAVFICENNGYGMGTAVARASAVKNLSVRGNAYDMPAETVDGQDVLVVREAMDRAVARARTESKPTLLEIRTYRFVGHSMSDAAHGTYRSKDEVEEYRRRDPIKVLAEQMRGAGTLDDARWSALEAEVKAEVDDAYTFAEESPDPDPAELFTDVYAPATGNGQQATGNS